MAFKTTIVAALFGAITLGFITYSMMNTVVLMKNSQISMWVVEEVETLEIIFMF